MRGSIVASLTDLKWTPFPGKTRKAFSYEWCFPETTKRQIEMSSQVYITVIIKIILSLHC